MSNGEVCATAPLPPLLHPLIIHADPKSCGCSVGNYMNPTEVCATTPTGTCCAPCPKNGYCGETGNEPRISTCRVDQPQQCTVVTYDPSQPKGSPNASVLMGNVMPVPLPGYWADVNQFDQFEECIPPQACPGYGAPCTLGYTGKQCGFCSLGYDAVAVLGVHRCVRSCGGILVNRWFEAVLCCAVLCFSS